MNVGIRETFVYRETGAQKTCGQRIHFRYENSLAVQRSAGAAVSPELRTALLNYYGDLSAPFATKKDKKEWAKVVRNVNQLNALLPAAEAPANQGSLR